MSGYANPTATGSLFQLKVYSGTLIATDTIATFVFMGYYNAASYLTSYMAYDGASLIPSHALPADLLSFTLLNKGYINDLSWRTATEQNSKYFIIERSGNGIDFEPITSLFAAGISTSPLDYDYEDVTPLVGKNYYRLKEVDIDGKSKYSGVRFINVDPGTTSINVFPNPTIDIVNIKGLTIGSQISIIDGSNRKIFDIITKDTNQKISVGNITKGIYILLIRAADGSIKNIKLIKQ